MSESGSGTAVRSAILVVILVAVASAFGYEKMFVTKQMDSAEDRLTALVNDTANDHSKEGVKEAIGFAPASSTDLTESYRWTSVIGKRHELNVYYAKKGDDGLTLKTFNREPLVLPNEKDDTSLDLVDWTQPRAKDEDKKLFGGGGGDGVSAADVIKRTQERRAAQQKAEAEKEKTDGEKTDGEKSDAEKTDAEKTDAEKSAAEKADEKAPEKTDEKAAEKAPEKTDAKEADKVDEKKGDSGTEEVPAEKKESTEKKDEKSDG